MSFEFLRKNDACKTIGIFHYLKLRENIGCIDFPQDLFKILFLKNHKY